MKRNYLIILLLILVQMVSAEGNVRPTRINGIFYNLDASKKQAEVTYDWDYDGPMFENKTYKGTITIPTTVSYKGITYDVTSIGTIAFLGNYELKAVNIPNSILHIGSGAFDQCEKLQSLTIPKSVTDIEGAILNECDAITSIIVDKDNKFYDSRNNCNAIIHTATNELIQGCQNTVIPNTVTRIGNHAFAFISTLTSIDIPNSVTNIGDRAFRNTGLKSLVLPNSVIYLGDAAFFSCKNLTSVTLSESLENLPYESFEQCNITSITIPASVESIDNFVFHANNNKINIYIESPTPPSINNNAFNQKFWGWQFATIHVPVGYKDVYQSSDTWKDFTIIDDVVIPESVTGISTLTSNHSTQSNNIYTLSGKRLSAPRKGINIINGKKINLK